MFIGIFNEKKQEVKMLPTTEMISVVQKVDCYEPTVVETSEVFSLFLMKNIVIGVQLCAITFLLIKFNSSQILID